MKSINCQMNDDLLSAEIILISGQNLHLFFFPPIRYQRKKEQRTVRRPGSLQALVIPKL
jgi:hypothetical protein